MFKYQQIFKVQKSRNYFIKTLIVGEEGTLSKLMNRTLIKKKTHLKVTINDRNDTQALFHTNIHYELLSHSAYKILQVFKTYNQAK